MIMGLLTRRQLLGQMAVTGGLLSCATSHASSTDVRPSDVLFRQLDGNVVSATQYQGRVVVVHVFATWDMPSLRSVPDLRQLATHHKKDVAVVGVGLDREGVLALQAFVNAIKPGYPVWMPEKSFVEGRTPFGPPRQVPTTHFLRRDGTLYNSYVGYIPYEDLVKLVKKAG